MSAREKRRSNRKHGKDNDQSPQPLQLIALKKQQNDNKNDYVQLVINENEMLPPPPNAEPTSMNPAAVIGSPSPTPIRQSPVILPMPQKPTPTMFVEQRKSDDARKQHCMGNAPYKVPSRPSSDDSDSTSTDHRVQKKGSANAIGGGGAVLLHGQQKKPIRDKSTRSSKKKKKGSSQKARKSSTTKSK